MLAMLALGFAIVMRAEAQQRLSGYERTRESSFNLAEAALNAEALQLGRTWPTTSTAPTSCNPTSTNSACPSASALSGGYTYAAACSGSATPIWQTSVRDNVLGEQYWSTAVSSRLAYDANNDGAVWVRSTGYVQCNLVNIVALVSRNVVPMNFPNNVISANWFGTTSQGRKVLVDTLGAYAQPASIRPVGSAAQPAPIVVRCTGLTDAQCLNYGSSQGQVQPPAVRIDRNSSSSALSLSQLQSLEQQAISSGTFWATGSCPGSSTSLSSVNGAPVVIQGPCSVAVGGNSQVNSSTTPGALVIENGTFTLSGNAKFYGLLYCVNKQGTAGNASSGPATVTISGNSTIQGVIGIDGLGGVTAGSSLTNVIYDPRATGVLRGASGASVNKNSFRILPQGTP
jgi:hypothetical protein